LQARIVANQEISPTYYRMGLAGPDLEVRWEPGQFFMLKIGQGIDPLLRRPFSIHWMEKGYLEILYRVVGKGTARLPSLRPGEKVDLLGPLGRGFTIPAGLKVAFLVAGGMGVAPLRGLAGQILARWQASGTAALGRDRGRKIEVVIGGKRRETILSGEKLREMGVEVHITTEDGSLGQKGLATDLLEEIIRKYKSTGRLPSVIYVCGPRSLLARAAQMAALEDIPCQVSLEEYMACGIGACMGCAVKTRTHPDSYQLVCKDGPVFEAQEIPW
jgi:dihydroorotate dehydrogenase electron transfer subunit